ncbi:MAG: GNAT family N-acetyltransferase [Clostridia bacterium]|nr:GNAT family N-acetyltransferase [Clostridia bacterium]
MTSLQPIREIDEARFFEIATSSHVTSRLPDWQMTMTYARRLAAHSRAEFLSPADQQLLFGIYEDGELVGALSLGPDYRCDYRVAVGFFVGEAYTRRGSAGRAIEEAEKIAAAHGIDQLHALAEADNLPSVTRLQKSGFTLLGECFLRRDGERERRRNLHFAKKICLSPENMVK